MTGIALAEPRPARWPWVVLAVIVVGSSAWIPRYASASTSTTDAIGELGWLALAPLFASLGVLIMTRQPGNRIGLLLLASGTGLALDTIAGGSLLNTNEPPSEMTPLLFLRLWLNNWSWVAAFFPIFLLLYVFPTGELLTRRWLWAPRLLAVMASIIVFLTTFSSMIGPINESWMTPNPIGFVGRDQIDVIFVPWLICLFVVAAGGVAAMVIRYRRSSYVEKTQIKWVLLAVAYFGAVYGMSLVLTSWVDEVSWLGLLFLLGVAGIPVSITVAILRYQLFAIDVIISRSLAYGTLAVFIGSVYVGIVVGVGELLGQQGKASFGLSVAATSFVALAFQPVRLRVERLANRVVYGQRATPYEVLSQFSRGSIEESDDELLARIPQLIADGTGASTASLWVRSSDGFRIASTWPTAATVRRLEDSSPFDDPEADFSLPVFHDGELLGGISLTKGRGDTITPAEIDLLTNLAGGMGLALRNTRLTTQLRQQVKDLRRSRDRIVNAADEARRSLENDLDSGPQQHLVAVKVRLGASRVLAEKCEAPKTASLLADIENAAGEAIQAVRDFASGIYPPLLGAEGLGVALAHQARRAALEVSVKADGVGRYPRDVESAIYFSVLEALQNTAKYAAARSAQVTLVQQNGDLLFEVSDDGQGFDPTAVSAGVGLNGIADRIDTVGGTWRIDSSPGHGTKLSGTVPTSARVPA